MKYIAITFDDGRSDNYAYAKPIMDKYNLKGTVYITTGFIDGTWEGQAVLGSPTRPLSIEEIVEMHEAGWEIGLHGDKHQTQVNDMQTALSKLQSWGIKNECWSISVPNSAADEASIEELYRSAYGSKIAYVRRGRKCDTSKLSNRVLFVAYSLLKCKWAYRMFNRENIFQLHNANKSNIPSVVIKSNDAPELVANLIKHAPDGSAIVLMLHSVLPAENAMCRKDPWSWEDKKFESLCAELAELEQKGVVKILPLAEQLKV